MARRTNTRNVERRKLPWIPLLLLCVIAAGSVLVYPMVKSSLTGEFYVNPKVSLKADETYTVQLWVVRPILPDQTAFRKTLDEHLAEFQAQFSNVVVEITHLTPIQANQRFNEAYHQGNPPDVFFHAESAQVYYGGLQVPLAQYLDKEEAKLWPEALINQATVGKKLYSLPVAVYPKVMLANTSLLAAEDFDLEQVASNGWSWGDFLAAAEASAQGKTLGFAPTSIGEPLLRSIAASLGKPAALADDGTPLWQEADLISIAKTWEAISGAKGVPTPANNMDHNSLDLFLRKQAAMVGPVNHRLAEWLWQEASEKGINLQMLPIPHAGVMYGNEMKTINISLFRQSEYRGHRHTKAAAELVRFLAPKLGQVLAATTGAVPAQLGANSADLPYDEASLRIYAATEHAMAMPFAYGPQAGLSEDHWQHTIVPAWDNLIAGQFTAEQFAQAVLTGLAAATIAGP